MGTEPAAMVRVSGPSSSTLETLDERVNDFILASKAPATLRAYCTDWADFTHWCADRGLAQLPAAPETVARYLTDLAGVKAIATIQRRITSISQAHWAARHEPPTRASVVRETWRGIRRTFGVAPIRKAPLRATDIRSLVSRLDTSRLIGIRDRATRSRVRRHLQTQRARGPRRRRHRRDRWRSGGHHPPIQTDQEGEGASIGLPYGSDPAVCPVRTLRTRLDSAGIEEGAVFRHVDRHGRLLGERISGRAAAERVKRACREAGLEAERYGGHSLRAGLITSAIEGGASEHRTMQHSRHRSVHVFGTYVRDLNLLDGSNPLAMVGL